MVTRDARTRGAPVEPDVALSAASDQAARASNFHTLHHGSGLLTLPTAWDALSAKLFEREGAKAIGTSSAAVAWTRGFADGERLPFRRLVALARDIVRSTTLPLSVDIERGFASDLDTLKRNVLELLAEGVVGFNLEDGSGAPDELCAKLEAVRSAALVAGHTPFFNARCDVFYRPALAGRPDAADEALRRGDAYRQAGADGIFLPGLIDPETIQLMASTIGLPLNLMMAKGLPPSAELARLGVRRVSAGAGLAIVAYEAMRASAARLLESGDGLSIVAAMRSAPNYQRLVTG